MTAHHVFRQPVGLRLVATVLLAAVAVVCAAGGIDTGGWLMVAGPLAAVVALVASVRYWQLRLEVHSDEIRVVNWVRVLRIPWRDIERFGYDSGLWVRRRDGRQHEVAAFAADPGQLPSATRRGEDAARQLEAIRRRRRGQGGGRDR